jgi:hypothetical protein
LVGLDHWWSKPFTFCEQDKTRKYSTLKVMTAKTLKKYQKLTCEKVQARQDIYYHHIYLSINFTCCDFYNIITTYLPHCTS